ncbi:Discoidin domain-containing receptor [Nesidiocoris tenuis]|uniref:Discoidin domain-containing receptor n=1 Tax=Nesidiocoris tenuis TaxID=355587 RepID=A0ABN7B631_9HEMI|nr:Discoidin domain-containing receptor [Nesidiocoris tenuis]
MATRSPLPILYYHKRLSISATRLPLSLKHDKNGGAWCPRSTVSKDKSEYLQIDLGRLMIITGTRTQGRFGNGQGVEYTEEILLDYWRPGLPKWRHWKNQKGIQKLPGNTNTYTVAEQKLDPIIIASKIRFIPYSDHLRTVCMRVDILGCVWQEGVVSYSMPQGTPPKAPGEPDLRDKSYDGLEEASWITTGLGQLTDGLRGHDDFTMDYYGHGPGYEWVAWKNDSLGGPGRPVELVFEFDSLRNFSAMHLHTNNFFSKGVQVFSSAKVYLSIGGKLFSGLPIEYQYMPDTIMEHARNVTIKLHHVIGRFLKVQLYFESQWIMVSEVSFDSVVVPGNVTEEYFENNYVGAAQDVKDVPLQRDAVHSTLSKHEPGKAVGTSSVVSGGSPPKEPESKQLVGLLIGALTSVILLLLVAIVFIVFHSRNAKNSLSHASTDQFTAEKAMTEMVANKGHVYGQVGSTEDSEKGILYHEPFASANMYGLHPTTRSAEYADVPDIMQEYAVPLVSQPPSFYTSVPPQTPLRSLPPLHNFFPKPPPVPPPPEKYYAATEIVQKAPPVPSSPPPPSVSHSSSSASSSAYGQILHPPSSESRPSATADLQLNSIPRSDLKYLTKLGIGHFGEVHLVEVLRKTSWSRSCSSKYVVVKALHKDSPLSLRESFEREMEELLPLNHENISCVLGACFDQAPPLLVMEYTEHGDLYQFLQNHVAESTSLPHSHAETLSYGSLIYMASQIAAGMKYLEQKNYILNDLATRNCIVGDDYRVKIADFGVSPHVYPSDYVELPGRGACPIRWMAWETIVLSKCTSRSVVWSFAVTLWEILTFAREQPFEDLTDEKVLENAKIFEKPNGKPITLAQPIGCHKEVYDLMCECWQRKEADRPTFKEIHMFLQRKNLGYKHQLRNS